MNKPLKFLKIKKRRDFVSIQNSYDYKFGNKNILILIKKTSDFYLNKNLRVDICRIGFVATKKIDKRAVFRNKIKRTMRELVRINHKYFLPSFDYEFIAKKDFLKNDFITLKDEATKLMALIYSVMAF